MAEAPGLGYWAAGVWATEAESGGTGRDDVWALTSRTSSGGTIGGRPGLVDQRIPGKVTLLWWSGGRMLDSRGDYLRESLASLARICLESV